MMIQTQLSCALQESLQAAKDRLKTADENLIKYVGQNQAESTVKVKSSQLPSGIGEERFAPQSLKRTISGQADNDVYKKRFRAAPIQPSVFSRLSQGDAREILNSREDVSNGDKKVLNSTVVLPETRTREEAIKELEAQENRQVKERNRRMFGMMLGTLQKFVSSEKEKEQLFSVKKRKEIEEKVELGMDHEKEVIRKERTELVKERRSHLAEVRRLEAQVRLVELFESWKANIECMKGSIRTLETSGHHVFYKPKILCNRAKTKQEQSCRLIDTEIQHRKEKLEADISRILNRSQNSDSEHDSDTDRKSDEDMENSSPKKLLSCVSVVREKDSPERREMSTDREDSPVANGNKLGSVVQQAPSS